MRSHLKIKCDATTVAARAEFIARQKRVIETLAEAGADPTEAMAAFANCLLQGHEGLGSRNDDRPQ